MEKEKRSVNQENEWKPRDFTKYDGIVADVYYDTVDLHEDGTIHPIEKRKKYEEVASIISGLDRSKLVCTYHIPETGRKWIFRGSFPGEEYILDEVETKSKDFKDRTFVTFAGPVNKFAEDYPDGVPNKYIPFAADRTLIIDFEGYGVKRDFIVWFVSFIQTRKLEKRSDSV